MVEKGLVVTLDFVLRDKDGEVLDSSKEHGDLVYIHGYNQLLSGMEKALEGRQVGDHVKATLTPEEAYGLRDDSLKEKMDRKGLASVEPLEVGQFLEREMGDEVQWLTVLELTDNEVILDANHPLAGQTLDFEAQIKSVREATEEELDHGHVHHHHEDCDCEDDGDCDCEDDEDCDCH